MTTGDYVLWFGAFVILIIIGQMLISLMKWVEPKVANFWLGALGAGMLYIVLVAAVLSPTYYLIVRTS